jgi:hypothetical protein
MTPSPKRAMRLNLKRIHWALLTFALLLLLLAAAPMRTIHGGCLFCGRSRSEVSVCGIKVKDSVQATTASAWVDSMYPDHAEHIWSWGSSEHKRWGFGGRSIGCGGLGDGAIIQIHHLRSAIGEDRARDVLQRYHSQLRTDQAQLRQWLKREFQALVPANESATNGLEKGVH